MIKALKLFYSKPLKKKIVGKIIVWDLPKSTYIYIYIYIYISRQIHLWRLSCPESIMVEWRCCLLSTETVQDSAWYYSLYFFSLFHFFQQQSMLKYFYFFHFLYHINNFFITIQIKNSLKYKKNPLFYTNSFYIISHHYFLLILKLTTTLLCYVPVFAKQPRHAR
jgi:hypothetical protein